MKKLFIVFHKYLNKLMKKEGMENENNKESNKTNIENPKLNKEHISPNKITEKSKTYEKQPKNDVIKIK